MDGSPVRANWVQAALMTPAMARALGPPPVIGAVVGASGLSNTRETSSPWGDRSRPPMIGVVQSIW